MATTDDTGGNVIRYVYEPFGSLIRSWSDPGAGTSGSLDSEASASAPAVDNNPWSYASGYRDANTGLLKFGTRYYMPTLATWTQPDPKAGHVDAPLSLNMFGYVGDNPVNRVDASGRDWDDIIGGIATGVSTALGAATGFLLAGMGLTDILAATTLLELGVGLLGVVTGGAIIALTVVAAYYVLSETWTKRESEHPVSTTVIALVIAASIALVGTITVRWSVPMIIRAKEASDPTAGRLKERAMRNATIFVWVMTVLCGLMVFALARSMK